MWPIDCIAHKRDGRVLYDEEITRFIGDYTAGRVTDYQAAAWCMAVYLKGMDARETTALTKAMAESGDLVDLSSIPGIKVDKHSTGGIADTTTLIVAPLVAAAGVPVAKMSGRGLGFTGGTIDKLQSIPGFQTELSEDAFLQQVRDMGMAVISQSGEIAPADKLLYALRDATATVESIPLIASSIMSKKIASGADAIVFEGVVSETSAPTYTTTEKIEKNDDGSKTRTATTSQNVFTTNRLLATFIKYKTQTN